MTLFVDMALAALIAVAPESPAPAPSGDIPEQAAGDADKIICKKFIRTGSLVDGYRSCKTKREWTREREDAQEINRSYSCRVEDNAATPCR